MAKKKKGRPKKTVSVGGSSVKERRATWVRGFFRRRTKKAFRIQKHTRNPRRSERKIAQIGTRKEERRRNIKKRHPIKVKKTKQTKINKSIDLNN